MKKIYSLITILFVTLGFAQNSTKNTLEVNSIPAGYYDTAIGTGYTLKTQLFNIIDNNTNSGSNASYGDLWTLYTQTAMRDNYYENDGSLLDLYSENPTGSDPYNFATSGQQCSGSTPSAEGGCYNREHIIPQNVFSSNYPMYSDAHFVLPSDNRVNAWRDVYPFGLVNTASIQCSNSSNDNTPCYTRNGSRLGPNTNTGYATGYTGVVFEPIDAFKGDVARSILYFVTRYQDQIPTWTYSMFNGTTDQSLTDTFLKIMIQWHQIDPPSQYEIDKNNAIYVHQGNRNPYIDRPEYVCQIWSTVCAALSNGEVLLAETDFNIYPNPSNGTFRIDYDTTIGNIDVEIYSTLGQKVFEKQNIDNHIITTNGLQSGVYLLKITNESRSTFKKIIIN